MRLWQRERERERETGCKRWNTKYNYGVKLYIGHKTIPRELHTLFPGNYRVRICDISNTMLISPKHVSALQQTVVRDWQKVPIVSRKRNQNQINFLTGLRHSWMYASCVVPLDVVMCRSCRWRNENNNNNKSGGCPDGGSGVQDYFRVVTKNGCDRWAW